MTDRCLITVAPSDLLLPKYKLVANAYGKEPYFEQNFGSTEEAILFASQELDR